MGNYRILYRLRIDHDFFNGKKCAAIQCSVLPQGQELLKRRGMIFRQTDVNEWVLLYLSDPDTENDVLMLNLALADSNFSCYTAWNEFRPSEAYVLNLPHDKKEIDAALLVQQSPIPRRIGQGFCTLHLHLTQKMVNDAVAGKPLTNVVHFFSPSVQWEYIFIPRTDDSVNGTLKLHDETGKIDFTTFKKCEIYGQNAWRTQSCSPVPMHQIYGCKLRLLVQESGKQERELLSHVDPPSLCRYQSTSSNVMRQIYYY